LCETLQTTRRSAGIYAFVRPSSSSFVSCSPSITLRLSCIPSPTTHHTRHTFAWIEPTAFIGTSGSPLNGAITPKKAAAPRSSFVMRVRACASTLCRDGSPLSWPSLHHLLRDSSICLIAVVPLVSTSIHPTARGCIMESMLTRRSWLKVELRKTSRAIRHLPDAERDCLTGLSCKQQLVLTFVQSSVRARLTLARRRLLPLPEGKGRVNDIHLPEAPGPFSMFPQ
jgi:hypothetical protein